MSKHTPGRLTKEQREAMAQVLHGADVYDYGTAMRLREVEYDFPALIRITKAMSPPADGAARQPYFGAILTRAGRAAIAKAEGKATP